MTQKKWITVKERRANRHAHKLGRAEQLRTDPKTGDLSSTFTQPEIGAVIGLAANTVDDIERQALEKVRVGLATELGIESYEVTDAVIGRFLIKHMATGRLSDGVSQDAGDKARSELPYKMLLDDLKETQQLHGTVQTLQALREQLDEGVLDEQEERVVRDFIKTLEAEAPF